MQMDNIIEKITVPLILERKRIKDTITVLTAYDFQMSGILDRSGIDILLVGDSLGNVVYGFDNTLPVTMDMMVAHTAAVARGRKRALLVSDMPFMSYHVSVEEAIKNAGRLVKEGGAEAVKLEGGVTVAKTVRRIVETDIPVMGHIGLRPQAINTMGGYKVQGRKKGDEARLLAESKSLEDAGAFAIVLEGIPHEISRKLTDHISIPTIGIGAGSSCDGQVLVVNDLLGISGVKPKFVRNFAMLSGNIENAIKNYIKEVKEGTFPSIDESYRLK